ncbi:TetR/AcrR family transcriptional regulator [Enterococcus olivae]
MNGFEKRREIKKKQILEATFDLLNSGQGVKQLKIESIVQKADVGKTTIFKYFGSKENLIHEVFKQLILEAHRQSKEIMAKNLSFEETFVAFTKSKLLSLEEISDPLYLDLMAYMTTKDGSELSQLMEQVTQESIDIMLDLFHRGRKEGKVDLKYSDEFLILYFETLIEGMSHPMIYERVLLHTEEWMEVLLKGMTPNT